MAGFQLFFKLIYALIYSTGILYSNFTGVKYEWWLLVGLHTILCWWCCPHNWNLFVLPFDLKMLSSHQESLCTHLWLEDVVLTPGITLYSPLTWRCCPHTWNHFVLTFDLKMLSSHLESLCTHLWLEYIVPTTGTSLYSPLYWRFCPHTCDLSVLTSVPETLPPTPRTSLHLSLCWRYCPYTIDLIGLASIVKILSSFLWCVCTQLCAKDVVLTTGI